jgi:hypothetical protein
MSYRRAAAAFGSFCALAIAVAACSSGSTGSQAGTTATATSVATAGAAPISAATATVVPASTSRSSTSRHSGLTVSITGMPSRPVLAPGGPALEFTVDIRNGTRRAYRDITPVVAIGHCTCVSTAMGRAPAGTLQEYSLITGKWRTVYYNTVGTGTDYLNVVEQAPLTLNPGATLSFTFRVKLDDAARQSHAVHAGQTGLLVTVVRRSSAGSATELATVRVGVPVHAA